MSFMIGSSIILLLSLKFILIYSTTIYQNDYEPRVFDYIPLNCYDCLSYRDIILTQLTTIPARSFENFNVGPRDTNMILNGQISLTFQPYAFQSFIIQKPNKTLTITFAASNSWLNITENTFNGLDLRSYSTLRIIIKFFYGCTFHKQSLTGIKMDKYSRLIIDISSVTQVHFENNIIEQNESLGSIYFIISRTDTIIFDSHSFSSLKLKSNDILSFHFEFISHINIKSYSFHNLQFEKRSSFDFYSLFLNRLSMESSSFQNVSFQTESLFNLTIQTLGTCLCFKSNTFDHFYALNEYEKDIQILFQLNNLRGLSFHSNTFSNLSLYDQRNQLKIFSDNSLNDPNPIINLASDTFSSYKSGFVLLNFSSTMILRFEKNFLHKNSSLLYNIYFQDITFIDFTMLDLTKMQINIHFYFNRVRYVKWFEHKNEKTNFNYQSLIKLNFDTISNNSCLIYHAPQSLPWLLSNRNTTICNCPLLFAYKHGLLDGQIIPCINSLTGHETAYHMNECYFDRRKEKCHLILESLVNFNNHTQNHIIVSNSIEIDNYYIRQLYDKNYLTCSNNYSSYTLSSYVVRSRLFNNFGVILGIILAIFIILLIIVMALLNSLQYKIREYDETWTWRRNLSWTSLRRTLSQTSLRRSRRDLRTTNVHVPTSKSDNQISGLRYEQTADSDDNELRENFRQT